MLGEREKPEKNLEWRKSSEHGGTRRCSSGKKKRREGERMRVMGMGELKVASWFH